MTSILTKEVTFLDAQERRNAVARELESSPAPVSATALAKQFSVSRQIIVGDIALLRAAGADITATPRGYITPRSAAGVRRTLACRHSGEDMEAELNAIVDHGCTVLDVIVDHPIYGQLTGPLNLSNRYEVSQFILHCREESAAPLSLLTEGIHLHTVLCPDEQAFSRVREALRQQNVLLED
ncbi:MAG: transcription repressor NadR [Oscillospiraceae bacterium]|nr:transcription repressor NadR [Oscillospiraceae bacterium]